MPGEMHEKEYAPKRLGYVWTSCLTTSKVIFSLRRLGQMYECTNSAHFAAIASVVQ